MNSGKNAKTCIGKNPKVQAVRQQMLETSIKLHSYVSNERGEFGIKQIAATVAAIVIIAAVTTVITGNSKTWVESMWVMFTGKIQELIAGS